MPALRSALFAVAALSACGGAPGEPAVDPSAAAQGAGPHGAIVAATVPGVSTTATPPEPQPGPHRVTLRFELNGRKFPLPLVHGSVAGEPVWMLVDTGANSHVIASWVARKVGLPMRALGDVGSDHTGRAVSAYTVEHP